MASKHIIGKNTSGQNQPPSREFTNSQSNKPLEFQTFNPSGRYSPHISSHSTPNSTYTSSPKTSNPNPNYSLIEEPHGVTLEELVFQISNNEVNQLR